MKNKSFLLSVLFWSVFFESTMLCMHRFSSWPVGTALSGRVIQAQRRIPYQCQQTEQINQAAAFFDKHKKKIVGGVLVGAGLYSAVVAPKKSIVIAVSMEPSDHGQIFQESYSKDEYRPISYPENLAFKEISRQERGAFEFITQELLKDAPENQEKIKIFTSRVYHHIQDFGVIRCMTQQDNQECGILFYTVNPDFYTEYNQGVVFIYSLGVPKKFRRQGIATQMLSVVESVAEKRGDIGELCLYVVQDQKARQCYENFGFHRVYGHSEFNMSKVI